MASPQLEDGYIRLARELCIALTKFELSGPEFRVALAVIGKTYGWNKKRDQISFTQFVQLTELPRRTIIRAISNLVSWNVLGSVKGDTRTSSTYWIQKDYDKWKVKPSVKNDTTLPSVTDDTRPSAKSCINLVSNLTPTIYNTKDNIKDMNKKQLLLKQQQGFEVTWGIYPRKLGKPQSFSKYCKTVLTAEQAKQCKRAVENYLAEIEDKGTEDKFIKHGSTFFGMWQDYYALKPFDADESETSVPAFGAK